MKAHWVTVEKKSKELICFSKIGSMLEMLRNWGEHLLFIRLARMGFSHSPPHLQKKEAETMHFTFIKEKGICREHDKCRK